MLSMIGQMLTRTLTLMLRLAKSVPRRFGFTLESDDGDDDDDDGNDDIDSVGDNDDCINKR